MKTRCLLMSLLLVLPSVAGAESADEVRSAWMKILGAEAQRPAGPVNLEVLVTEELPDFTRQYVRYEIEPGVLEDGYLLLPKPLPAVKAPGVVVFHSTVKVQAKLVAGIDSSVPDKQQGVHLVKLGFVVLCPRNFIFDEGADFAGNVTKMKQRHPARTGMWRMTLDGMRALDVLASLPQVDAARLGVTGHSLGAKEALYMAALDPRVKAAVSSEGGVGLKMSNWEAEWYLGPQIKAPDFKRDHEELLRLIAPRAFLLLGGNSADTDESAVFIKAALPAFEAAGVPGNLQFLNHGLGHAYPPVAREKAEAFLLEHLKPKAGKP